MENIVLSNDSFDSLALYNNKTPEPLDLAYYSGKDPRYYQINGILKLNYYLENNYRRILFIMPTGSGKTLQSKLVVLSNLIRKTMKWDKKEKIRVLFIVHKMRLLRQATELFESCEDIEFIPQSAFKDIPEDVINEGWDITFIDEAQHEAMNSIQLLLDQLIDVPIIGFTANPNRGDNLLVKFEQFIVPITKEDAIREGFISNPAIVSIMDTGGQDKSDLVISLVEKYHSYMGNTIVFFKTNKECEKFYQYCIRNNLTATWLDSSSSERHLDKALDDLSNCRIQFLINCKRTDEGIDVLNCTDVITARNFNIASEKEQLAGRCIRPDTPSTIWELVNPYKEVIEVDQVLGAYRAKHFIYRKNNEWFDSLLEGEDPTWGYGEQLRHTYLPDYKTDTDSEYLDAIKEDLIKTQSNFIKINKNIDIDKIKDEESKDIAI